MADEIFTADEPFRRRQWTGDNLAELRAFTGQDLSVNGDGSVTVRMGVPGGGGEDCDVLLNWYVRVSVVDGAVGVSSRGAAERHRLLDAA